MALVFCQIFKPVHRVMFPEDRPSPLFTAFSCIINTVTVILALTGMGGDCPLDDVKTWHIVAALLGIGNIIFACYIYWRFCTKLKEQLGVAKVVWSLLLYDWGVCVYIMWFIFLVIWMSLGKGHEDDAEELPACKDHADSIDLLNVLFMVYIFVGGLLVCFSILTECCQEPRWKKQGNHQAAHVHTTGGGGMLGGILPNWRPGSGNHNNSANTAPPPPPPQQQPVHYAQPAPPPPPQQQPQYPPPPMHAQAPPPQQQAPGPSNNWGDHPSASAPQQPQQQTAPPQQQYGQQEQWQQPPPQQQPPAKSMGHRLGEGVGKLFGGKK